jgi:hypothetical protein
MFKVHDTELKKCALFAPDLGKHLVRPVVKTFFDMIIFNEI